MGVTKTIKNLLTKTAIFWEIAKVSLPVIIVLSLISWPIVGREISFYIFLLLFGVFIFVLVFILITGYRKVEEGKVALVERLGHFNREIDPGPNWIIPFIESLAWVSIGKHRHEYIDMREQVHDIEAQNVFTKDKVPINIDTILFWKIENAQKVAYELRNVVQEIDRLVFTSVRDIVADINFDDVFSQAREIIRTKVPIYMERDVNRWGVKIIKIDVENIMPSEDMRAALERKSVAEKDLETAELEKQTKIKEAEGEAERIKRIYEAIQKAEPDDKLVQLQYLEALKEMAKGDANKIFMPFEASNLLTNLGLGGEMLKTETEKP